MATAAESLPRVSLNREQWLRLVVVGVLVFFAIGRVVPDVVRLFYPLGIFGYVTDSNGVVVHVTATPTKGSDVMLPGDRVRIDRVKPFDRKPGLVGLGYSYDNRVRYLPIESHGRERTLRLIARDESLANRILTVLRILIFVTVVCFGAILFIMAPSIGTAAIFAYTLGGEFPTTYGDLIIPNPWRQIPELLAIALAGAARSALLVFAMCLIYDSPRVQRRFAIIGGALALVLGTLHAFGFWQLIYAGHLAQGYDDSYAHVSSAITVFTIVAFIIAFAFAHGIERRRIGWIVATFALASAARLASDEFYPAVIAPWVNGLLLTATVLPILVVWIAVIRNQFFNVDFVVSRAIVYVALTAGAIGAISIAEEIATYVFVNNSDLAYGVLIVLATAVGALTGKLRTPIEKFIDRFIFRERRTQRKALEFIAGYILDAEAVDDVYRALLEDATHALQLSFAGVLARAPDGTYRLSYQFQWPPEYVVRLSASDALIEAIGRSRGALSFSGRDTRLIGHAFPGERLTFAAPLFFDRSVSAIVVYGRNVSGLDLDPDEREMLVRVVAHASIALSAIELTRYKKLAEAHAVAAP